MATKILLINAGPTGTESLKNLVLPGVGQFTVLDNAVTTKRDLANNFFITADSVGKPRAQVTCELLQEMNADVVGDFRVGDVATLAESEPDYFKQFTIIMYTQPIEACTRALGAICAQAGIPLLVLRAYGLLGYCRLVLPEHIIIESKPDFQQDDLRLCNPWPELLEYVAPLRGAAVAANLTQRGHRWHTRQRVGTLTARPPFPSHLPVLLFLPFAILPCSTACRFRARLQVRRHV
jgi:amyloid beta precursor protein binding protein 1